MVGLDVQKLRELRKTRDLTLAQVAEKTGITLNLLSQYERGETHPPSDNLLRLLDFYRVTNFEVTKKNPA